jgi:pyruvate formate lyase activating enzyme
MNIGGLQKVTLVDYPGEIACAVFLSGCNFRCPWCHNPELVWPEKIKKHPKISEKTFFSFLKQRKGLLDGVCITGGEPTIYKNLPGFIKKIKKLGFLVKLDTNGSNPEMLKKLINNRLIDYVAMDVKAPLKNQNYNKAIGAKVDLTKIKKSIELIKNSGLDYEFRTTVLPKIHKDEDIINIAKYLKGTKIYYLQPYRKPNLKIINQKKLESLQKKCQKYIHTELRN